MSEKPNAPSKGLALGAANGLPGDIPLQRVREFAELGFYHAPSAQLVICPFSDRVWSANLEACRLFRQNVPEFLQRPASHFFGASLPQLILFSQETLYRGQAWTAHMDIERSDGSRLRTEVHARKLRHGNRLYLQLSLLDAEAEALRRQRQEAQDHYRSGLSHWARVTQVFREFERENHLILTAAGEGIYGVDAEGRTTFLNPAAERMLGWSAEEIAGQTIHSLIHHSHADGCHYSVSDCPIYQAFKDGQVHSVSDEVFWTRDGRPIDVEYTSTPILDNGTLVGAVVIFRDVTARKQDKKRLLEALAEVEELRRRLELENAYLQEEINSEFNHHQIVGHSAAVQQLLRQIELVAPTDATVLIAGESGTGKELIARAIHESSQRSQRSLIRVNCAAIPRDLFESEFFGHRKGAFTGATADRPGRFELANGGTLFLDEVGEIPLELQGKLLRVLQEQQFERVGDSSTRHVDVRIIAATNRNLKESAERGEFRKDLYFRLNVFPIESVPLRERRDDIPLLAQHFLNRASARAKKSGLRISAEQMAHLQGYDWPGNIRELENIIERQVILAKGSSLRFEALNTAAQPRADQYPAIRAPILTYADQRNRQVENILRALAQCNGKVFGENGAARLLGISPTTLASQIKRFDINVGQFKRHNKTGA